MYVTLETLFIPTRQQPTTTTRQNAKNQYY